MSDLGTQLRTHVDSLVEGLDDPLRLMDRLIDESAPTIHVEGRGDSRSGVSGPRRRPSAVAAFALAVALVIAVVTVTLITPFGDENTTTTVPFGVDIGEWARVPDPTGEFTAETVVERVTQGDGGIAIGSSGIFIESVVDSPMGLVAVGAEQVGLRSVAAVWTSGDRGSTWSRVPHDDSVFGAFDDDIGPAIGGGWSIREVVFSNGRFVAVGMASAAGVGPVAWYSDDGRTWIRVSAEDGPLGGDGLTSVTGLVAGGPGFVAVGGFTSGNDENLITPLVWTSEDGETWRTYADAIPPGSGVIVAKLVIMDGAIVAVGQHQSTRTAAAWSSEDGFTWHSVDLVDTTGEPPGTMLDVVVTREGAVAVGRASPSLNVLPDIAVWTTEDGRVWRRLAPPDLFDERRAGPVAWGPAGFILPVADWHPSGSSSTEDEETIMLRSIDGENWEELPTTLSGTVRDLIVVDSRYLAVGAALGPEQPDPDGLILDGAVWIAGLVPPRTEATLPPPATADGQLVASFPQEGPIFGERTGMLLFFDDGLEGLTAFDPDSRLVARSTVTGQRAGDEPYSMIRVGDKLVVGWAEPHAVDIASREATSLGEATIFLPAAEPDRVWLIDHASGRLNDGPVTAWQVDLDGRALSDPIDLTGLGDEVIGIHGGLAIQASTGFWLHEFDTGRITRLTDGAGWVIDVKGPDLVWCSMSCRELVLTNTSTLESRVRELPAGYDFLHAGGLSPDGRYVAALIVNAESGDRALWVYDRLDDATAAVVSQSGVALGYVAWSPDGHQVFATSGSYGEPLTTIWRYDLVDRVFTAVTLPLGNTLRPVVVDASVAPAYFDQNFGADCPAPGVSPSQTTGPCTFGL